jgi:hypothetical protein
MPKMALAVIALGLAFAPFVSTPATAETQRTIVGDWQDQSSYGFSIRKIGSDYDIRWINQGLSYSTVTASESSFVIQLDQGLQQTFNACSVDESGNFLTCKVRFIYEGQTNFGDPHMYRRVR